MGIHQKAPDLVRKRKKQLLSGTNILSFWLHHVVQHLPRWAVRVALPMTGLSDRPVAVLCVSEWESPTRGFPMYMAIE